ncbi:hypothetical protein BQ8482_50021 [Mesorhizobium delmotii]|uniref:Propionyl-coenzyme A carboxylase alpha polypeptide n=1 Tax=Mesorhizobium delmotii TaxID=1631247 RepID=A0A2P9AUG3_9HYPH|nr:hypothetical protein BQ8482_50021 [Mesorhizobium delmotii]
MSHWLSRISNVAERAVRLKLPISPLAGEMAGRPEGGVKERNLSIPAAMNRHPIICGN